MLASMCLSTEWGGGPGVCQDSSFLQADTKLSTPGGRQKGRKVRCQELVARALLPATQVTHTVFLPLWAQVSCKTARMVRADPHAGRWRI